MTECEVCGDVRILRVSNGKLTNEFYCPYCELKEKLAIACDALRAIQSDGNLHQDSLELNEAKKEIAREALQKIEGGEG